MGLYPANAGPAGGIPPANARERPPAFAASGGFFACFPLLVSSVDFIMAAPFAMLTTFSPSEGSEMMSKRLERRFRLLRLFCRMKYFCACDATCVGVRDCTKCLEIPRQSPWKGGREEGGGERSLASDLGFFGFLGDFSRETKGFILERTRGSRKRKSARHAEALIVDFTDRIFALSAHRWMTDVRTKDCERSRRSPDRRVDARLSGLSRRSRAFPRKPAETPR